MDILEEFLKNNQNRTLAIITEVPTNPLVKTTNMQKLRELCDRYNIVLVVDSTFATPYNLNLKPYADIFVESLTKFACGNADVLMGAIILNSSFKVSHIKNEFFKHCDTPYIKDMQRMALEIVDYEVQNSLILNEPIVENYSFKSTNSVEIIGDKMYFSPLLYFAISENPFKQENREYPVDFIFPNQDSFRISLTIPEGYTVESLPESKVVAMPENMAKFTYDVSKNNNQVQLSYTFDVNKVVVENIYYETLKDFFKELVNKNTERIVLKKI